MAMKSCQPSFASLFIYFACGLVFTGCQKKSPEPQVAVDEDQQQIRGGEIGGVLRALLDGRRFPLDGQSWKVTQDDIQNVVVHDTKENADGSLTADVSFESMREGKGIAVDTLVQYDVQILDVPSGKGQIATHNVTRLQPKTIEKIGAWAKP